MNLSEFDIDDRVTINVEPVSVGNGKLKQEADQTNLILWESGFYGRVTLIN